MRRPSALFALVLALLGAAPASAQRSPDNPYPWLGRPTRPEPHYPDALLSARELHHLPRVRRPAILDLRAADRYARGHLPDARRLDFAAPLAAALGAADPAAFARWLAAEGVAPNAPLLLYTDAPGRADLARLAWALDWAGYPLPRILDGGVTAWAQRGGELTEAVPEPPAPAEPPPPGAARPELLATSGWILAHLGEVTTCEVLDLRGEARWAGPAGHIPHALPYDILAQLPADASWPQPPEARAAFARFGPRPRDTVDLAATFVLSGENAADDRPFLAYLYFRLMDVPAAVQLGGWAAWAADPALPTTRVLDAAALRAAIAGDNPSLADRPSPRLPLFDLRGLRDFRRAHLPGAVLLPAELVDDSLAVRLARDWPELESARDSLVVYCYGPDCVRSRVAATKAATLGWRRVLVFQGGTAAWKGAGLPLYGGAARATSRTGS
ncbi:MAG: rhodanese-like domain-containing protein [Candidatus Krumholzibacteriia bacterium]